MPSPFEKGAAMQAPGPATPEGLAALLQGLDRAQLIVRAQVAKSLQKTEATSEVVAACEALAS